MRNLAIALAGACLLGSLGCTGADSSAVAGPSGPAAPAGAAPPASKPAEPERRARTPLEAKIEAELRASMLAIVKTKLGAAPPAVRDIVITDDTPERINVRGGEEEAGEGEEFTIHVPAGSLRVPLAGLEGAGVRVADGAIEVRLGYAAADVTLIDRTKTPWPEATAARLLASSADFGAAIEREARGPVLAWARESKEARDAGIDEAAAAKRFGEYVPSIARWERRFRERAKDFGIVRRGVLWASAEAAAEEAELVGVYRVCRLALMRPALVASLGAPADAAGAPLAAGPTCGFRVGALDRDREVRALMVGGEDGCLQYAIASRDPAKPAGEALPEPALRMLLGTLRPGEGGRREAAVLDAAVKKPRDDTRANRARVVLMAASAYALAPTKARAARVIAALRRTEPPPPAAELASLAAALATQLKLAPGDADHLLGESPVPAGDGEDGND